MDWITGIVTIVGMELVSRKKWYGWLVCLLNQGLWAYVIVTRQLWGLVPLTCVLCWRYTSFVIAWRAERSEVVKCPTTFPR